MSGAPDLDPGGAEEVVVAPRRATTHDLPNFQHLAAMSTLRYSVEGAARQVGLEPDLVRRLRLAIGLADDAGELAVSDDDLDALRLVAAMAPHEQADEALVLQMARTMGHALSRVASSQMATLQAWIAETVRRTDGDPAAVTEALDDIDRMVGAFEELLVYVWRRQLGEAARVQGMAVDREPGATTVVETVGFGDLVDFVGRSHRIALGDLARIIDRFEAAAFTVVARHGGRVVKMIGDEVMFAVPRPASAVEIALELIEACEADEALPPLRVGLAYGPALLVGGDLFGPTVNAASRLVSVARPGRLVVTEPIRIAVSDNQGLMARPRLRRMRGQGLQAVHEVSRAKGSGLRQRSDLASLQDLAFTAFDAGRDLIGRVTGSGGDGGSRSHEPGSAGR